MTRETHSTLLLYQVLLILSSQNEIRTSTLLPLLVGAVVLFPVTVPTVPLLAVAALYISSTLDSTVLSNSGGAGCIHGSVTPNTSLAPGVMFPSARWKRMVRIMAPMQFFAIERSQVCPAPEAVQLTA